MLTALLALEDPLPRTAHVVVRFQGTSPSSVCSALVFRLAIPRRWRGESHRYSKSTYFLAPPGLT